MGASYHLKGRKATKRKGEEKLNNLVVKLVTSNFNDLAQTTVNNANLQSFGHHN